MSLRAPSNVLKKHFYSISRRNVSTATSNHDLNSSQQAIHTLRDLLRECSYLPDPQARYYLPRHIITRYRANKLKNEEKDASDPAWQLRLTTQQQSAQSALNQLRRANQGDVKPLLKVLLLTYGRIGKRRWDLMKPLLPVEGQDGEGAGEARTSTTILEENGKKPLPSLTPQLHALLLSHALTRPPSLTRPTPSVKKLKPNVPELNSWLRPMPQSRVRNLTKKWYRSLLERVSPPLPKDEWERLRDLARGKVVHNMLVERRPMMGQNVNEHSTSSALEAIVARGKIPNPAEPRRVHNITPRFMQRLWAKVFMQSAMMEWDDEKKKWTVVWGEHAP